MIRILSQHWILLLRTTLRACALQLPVEQLKKAIEMALGGTARIISAMRELQQRVLTNSSAPSSTAPNSGQTSSAPPTNYFTNPIVNVHPDLYAVVRQIAFNKVAAVLRTASHDKISRDEAIADVRSFVLSRFKGIHCHSYCND